MDEEEHQEKVQEAEEEEERSDLEDLGRSDEWQEQFRRASATDPSIIVAGPRARMPSLEQLDQSLDSDRPLTDDPDIQMENPHYWLDPTVPSDVYKVEEDSVEMEDPDAAEVREVCVKETGETQHDFLNI